MIGREESGTRKAGRKEGRKEGKGNWLKYEDGDEVETRRS